MSDKNKREFTKVVSTVKMAEKSVNYIHSFQFSFVHRCYYIAVSYEGSKKWKEAIGLYDRVLDYCNKALDGFKQLPKGQSYAYKVNSVKTKYKNDPAIRGCD